MIKLLNTNSSPVEVAYHSHHMAEVEKEYREAISEIKVQSNTEGDFFSSVTGQKAAACDLGPDYWVSNMLNEVKFSQSLQQLCLDTSSGKKTQKRNLQSKIDDIIEVGPHSALAGPIKQIIQANEKLSSGSIAYHSVLLRNKNAVDTVLKLVSSLFTLGYPVNLSRVNRISSTEKLSVLVDLPPYAWNHSNTYWHESWKSKAYKNRPFPRTDLLGALERTCSPMEPRWANHIRLSEIPWVRDHVIQANIVYPAAGYIVMVGLFYSLLQITDTNKFIRLLKQRLSGPFRGLYRQSPATTFEKLSSEQPSSFLRIQVRLKCL